MRRSPPFVVVALLLLLAGAGCSESPSRGFEKFYEALADGNPEEAAARLSTRARNTLQAAAAPRGLTAAEALAVTYPKTTVKSITIVDESAERAALDVTDVLGKSERVHMVKEDGLWKVDLGGAP